MLRPAFTNSEAPQTELQTQYSQYNATHCCHVTRGSISQQSFHNPTPADEEQLPGCQDKLCLNEICMESNQLLERELKSTAAPHSSWSIINRDDYSWTNPDFKL